MAKPRKDLTGKKFGRLTPIYYDDSTYITKNGKRISVWWCQCDCGNPDLIPVQSYSLTSGNSKSCGCLLKETLSKRNKENFKENRYDLSGEYGIGYDYNSKPFFFDLEDYDKIRKYRWKLFNDETTETSYVNAHEYNEDGKRTTIRMARLIMDCVDEDLEIDHINRIGYDNRKSNLRISTKYENSHNKTIGILNKSSIYGVNYDSLNHSYHVRIGYNGIRYDLGYYSDFTKASLVRLEKEEELFNEFMPHEHRKILSYIRQGGKVEYGNKELIRRIINNEI